MANLIQVLGVSYSGTTLTHLMLGNAEDAFACGEIHAFFRPHRTAHFRPVCRCGHDYSECLWRKFDHTRASRFHAELAEELGVNWVIDESKDLRWVIDSQRWAQKRMNVFNIVMVKDPLYWLHSRWKKGRRIEGQGDKYVDYYKCIIELGMPFICVNLEELTMAPKAKLKRICDLIGMNYFEGKERFWEKQHCYLFGNEGIRRQMEKGEMEIRPDPAPPDDFLQEARPEIEKLRRNNLFIETYGKLIEKEADNISHYEGVSHSWQRLVWPRWYYKKWWKSIKRRRHPHK